MVEQQSVSSPGADEALFLIQFFIRIPLPNVSPSTDTVHYQLPSPQLIIVSSYAQACYSFIGFPVPFALTIRISAMILTAISSGVSAFNSSPIGE